MQDSVRFGWVWEDLVQEVGSSMPSRVIREVLEYFLAGKVEFGVDGNLGRECIQEPFSIIPAMN